MSDLTPHFKEHFLTQIDTKKRKEKETLLAVRPAITPWQLTPCLRCQQQLHMRPFPFRATWIRNPMRAIVFAFNHLTKKLLGPPYPLGLLKHVRFYDRIGACQTT